MSEVVGQYGKMQCSMFPMASPPTVLSGSGSHSDYYLLADRMLQEKRFGSNKEVIAESEAYFYAKDKSFYKKTNEINFFLRWANIRLSFYVLNELNATAMHTSKARTKKMQ